MKRTMISFLTALMFVSLANAAPTSAIFNKAEGPKLSPKLAQLLRPIRLPDFTCDNTIYMTSRPYGTSVTQLSTINPYTVEPHDISLTEQYGYDAIGFNHLDGYIYGMSNGNSSGNDNPRLVRVNPANGDITDLGGKSEFDGEEWVIGTIIKDGTYVIASFATMKWLRINLETLEIVDSGTLPRPYVLAWAANPLDDVIYGYESGDQTLISFNPLTHDFQTISDPLTNVGRYPCSTAFYQDGRMFLYCKTADTTIDTMFEINLLTKTATAIASGRALGAGDMATCAFKKEEPTPDPEPEPDPDLEGTWQNKHSCIVIDKDLKTVRAFTKIGPLEIKHKEGELTTYQATTATSSTNTHGLIIYDEVLKSRIQEFSLIGSNKLRILELDAKGPRNPFNNYDRDIYSKVRRCRWNLPHIPFPKPHPKPKPTPEPPTPN